ncbi:hypothetical protein MNEG_7863 [Monoraphidium neglectum]|uniref:Amine oxidase domain-containing protein n=1 Tax=Monoraphidium neglectum TaxID=145388 RepID=A0A0D2N1F4_9CHLO|nr:hypothetical protein MNEG_7863 [Monoraphidium neglectum]KIZ00096.1 hypothetical protein MNEG_7863 [Monoraphidium neglectum]|eukprot:XP_013899115.1 hypothetical protein MNEG_7863 [Monoraphidium neglectum]
MEPTASRGCLGKGGRVTEWAGQLEGRGVRTRVTTAGKSYKATFAVVTLPLGVLKAGAVKFTPPLPADKTGAINRLAMGTLNKVILSLPAAAKLPSVNWISRIPLASDKGRWREFFSLKKATGRPVVVAFVAGKAALFPASDTDKSLGEQALAALRGILGGPANVPAPDQVIVTRWHADPFSLGSYSYSPAGADGTEREQLAAQVSNRLYFAGEATSEEAPSTVHGAYLTGEAAAGAALADHGSR